jgi:hypothetical protein
MWGKSIPKMRTLHLGDALTLGIWFFFFPLNFLRQLDWQLAEEDLSQICLEVKDKSFKISNPNVWSKYGKFKSFWFLEIRSGLMNKLAHCNLKKTRGVSHYGLDIYIKKLS